MSELKRISKDAVPRALELAERYRLLNEPEQAASICHDVLATDPDNQTALRTLFLATTEQFGQRHGTRVEDAEKLARHMGGEYEHLYYTAMAYERWARAQLHHGSHASMAGDWLRRAMEKYESAEAIRPTGNDDALLRWNACCRLAKRVPGLIEDREHDPLYSD